MKMASKDNYSRFRMSVGAALITDLAEIKRL